MDIFWAVMMISWFVLFVILSWKGDQDMAMHALQLSMISMIMVKLHEKK